MTDKKKEPEAVIEGVREDIWWISDACLNAATVIVAEQFIEDAEKYNYPSFPAFVERVTYVFRMQVPIIYSYFFDRTGKDTIPAGAVIIIWDAITKARPLFTIGGMSLDQYQQLNGIAVKGTGPIQ